jgi:hypothetical protein
MTSQGCAIGSDGELLDASQIDWYNDVDDNKPMTPSANATTAQNSSATLDSFVTKAMPAKVVAGSRRSARTVRPSVKATDPNNAAMTLKRKLSAAPSAKSSRHVRVVISDSEEEKATEPDDTTFEASTNPADDSDGNDTEPDVANGDDVYAETKAMGDADREVSIHVLPECRSLNLIKASPLEVKRRSNC